MALLVTNIKNLHDGVVEFEHVELLDQRIPARSGSRDEYTHTLAEMHVANRVNFYWNSAEALTRRGPVREILRDGVEESEYLVNEIVSKDRPPTRACNIAPCGEGC